MPTSDSKTNALRTSGAMKQISWSRVFVEGVVIVVSILLAFAIDAWWDGIQERRRGAELLSAVIEEIETNDQLLREVIQLVDTSYSEVRGFYRMGADLRALHPDSAHHLLESLVLPNTYELQRSALFMATNPEGARLIDDINIREVLGQLQRGIQDLDERFQLLRAASQSVLRALAGHSYLQERHLAGAYDHRSSVDLSVDLSGVWADPIIRAAATNMQQQREIYIEALRRLLLTIEEAVTELGQ